VDERHPARLRPAHACGRRARRLREGWSRPAGATARAGLRPGGPGYGEEPRERWGRLATEVNGVTIEGHVETLRGAYDAFYTGVRDAIRDGAPVPVDPRESLDVIRVIEAARQSAQRGETVRPAR
jgi:scyllo-inositol 2-dehydrogenase (NADP+)